MMSTRMSEIYKKTTGSPPVFLQMGFRTFFLGAAGFAFFSVLLWMGMYAWGWALQPKHLAPVMWHAHEMVFGYSIAVVTGFLLTAVKNWTGIQTLQGYPLLGLFFCWMAARLLPFFGGIISLEVVAITDNLFLLLLLFSVVSPLVKVKQWRNNGIAAIMLLFLISNGVFYLGALGIMPNGMHYGLYSGFYLILTLIFIMGRRVIPGFIERGVDSPVRLKNRKWLDVAVLVIFLLFWVAELLIPFSLLSAGLAGVLFVLHSIRLWGWHTPELWRKPLLWVLFLAYALIVLGFALKAVSAVYAIFPYLAIHAFAFGGIGMMTLGMMSRVSLGHTGRNLREPPQSLFWVFSTLFCGTLIRVIIPLLAPSHYPLWIVLSQILWLLAFGMFLLIFVPILISPRIDGRTG